jgi:hypothetical protein
VAHNVRYRNGLKRSRRGSFAQWEAWKNQDAASNNVIIADDFNSFWLDGSRHIRKPTAQQMSEQPITGYKLSQLRIVPVGAYGAIVTFADVKIPGDNVEHQGRRRGLSEAQRPVASPRLIGHANEIG